jgi:hypothetical protein
MDNWRVTQARNDGFSAVMYLKGLDLPGETLKLSHLGTDG